MIHHLYWVKRDKAGGSLLSEAWEVTNDSHSTVAAILCTVDTEAT